MKKYRLVTLAPCPDCGLEWGRDELYSCWEVRCKEHGVVMDHGSLSFGAYQLALHRKEHNLGDIEPSNGKQA